MKTTWKILGIAWAFGCFIALGLMIDYGLTPGPSANVARLPAGQGLVTDGQANLLLFVHPKCACTEATLAELARVLPSLEDTKVSIIFNNPSGKPEWLEGKIWDQARALKGVTLISDDGSLETQRFGVQTSGHAVLVDERGSVLFSGGITPSRGHEGETEGKALLQRWRELQNNRPLFSKIFGCSLFKERT